MYRFTLYTTKKKTKIWLTITKFGKDQVVQLLRHARFPTSMMQFNDYDPIIMGPIHLTYWHYQNLRKRQHGKLKQATE